MKDDIKNLVQALHDKCMTLVNPNSLYDYEVELDVDKATALIDDCIGALAASAPEPREQCGEVCSAIRTITLQDNGIILGEHGEFLGRMKYDGHSACDAFLAREGAEPAEERGPEVGR